MTVVAMIIGACLAMCVLTTSVWFGRGPRGRLANGRSFRARASWRVWLWAERAWVKADMRSHDAQVRRSITLSDASFVESVCVRLGSVWVGHGYRRVWVRRVLYGLRLARHTFASWFWYVVCDRVLVAYAQHPGRYERLGVNDSHIVAAALEELGSDEWDDRYGLTFGPFAWTDRWAAYITHVDEAGFFTYAPYASVEDARQIYAMAVDAAKTPRCYVCGEPLGEDADEDVCAQCRVNFYRRGYAITR